MADYPLAALAIKPSGFDPVGVLQTAAQLQGAQSQNQLASLRMQELQEQMRENSDRRGALHAFRDAGGMANPAALSTLNAHPDVYTQALGAMDARQKAFVLRNAQAAREVMNTTREGTPERDQAFRTELDRALAEGRIDADAHQRFGSQPATNLFLQNLVSLATPISDNVSTRELMDMFFGPGGGNAATANQTTAAAPPAGGRVPLSVRTNNPGAITMGRFAQTQGANGIERDAAGNPVARFDNPEQGAAAMFRRLATGTYAGMPLGQALSTWWTGQPDRADPRLIATVAQRAGLSPNTPVTPELLASPQGVALAQAMAQHEAGRPSPLSPDTWRAGQRIAFGDGAVPAPAATAPVPGIVVDNTQDPSTNAPAPAGFTAETAANPNPNTDTAATDGRTPLQRLAARGTEAQQASLKLLLAKKDFDGVAKLLQEIEGKGLNPRQRVETEEGLRKEFASLAKDYFQVRDSYGRIEAASRNPSAAGDLALIFNFMKMLDPGSVVRESEFATAQNATGVPDRVRNLYNRLLNGERLNENQRTDFLTQSGALMTSQERQYQGIQRQYGNIADRLGVDRRNIMIDFTRPPQEEGGTTTRTPPPASNYRVIGVR